MSTLVGGHKSVNAIEKVMLIERVWELVKLEKHIMTMWEKGIYNLKLIIWFILKSHPWRVWWGLARKGNLVLGM